jgi:hypothetical protein
VADDAAGVVGVRTALTFPSGDHVPTGLLVVPGLPLSIPDLKAVGVKTKPSPTIRAKQAHPVSRRYPEPASIAGLTEAVAVTVPKLNRVVTRKAAVFNPLSNAPSNCIRNHAIARMTYRTRPGRRRSEWTRRRLWHPWLRINRVLRVMPRTHWSAEAR